jgi:hypothetical protein
LRAPWVTAQAPAAAAIAPNASGHAAYQDRTGGSTSQKPIAATVIPAQATRRGDTAQRTSSFGDAESALT